MQLPIFRQCPVHDSQAADPQSWNKYVYVRNNPLMYIDPTGEKATVRISTDETNKTGTIVIDASIVLWTNKEKLKQYLPGSAKLIKEGIEKGWSGTFVKDGITYTVKANIEVQVAQNEKEALNSEAQNIIEITTQSHDVSDNLSGRFRTEPFSSHDRGIWGVNPTRDVAAHEFGHLLGIGHGRTGLMGPATGYERQATNTDYERAFGSVVNHHREMSRQSHLILPKQGIRRVGPPRNRTSNVTLRAPFPLSPFSLWR